MNTTFHWRANATNLLSREFLGLMSSHLNSRGIAYYNTTGSPEALLTAAIEFPYALRISGFLAVSEGPFTLDEGRWKAAMTAYQIDGKPVLDLSKPDDQARLQSLLSLAGEAGKQRRLIESRESMLARFKGSRIITDDNMGTEWK
jgi:hypothetical protein